MDSDKSNNDKYHVLQNKIENSLDDPICGQFTQVIALSFLNNYLIFLKNNNYNLIHCFANNLIRINIS